MSLVDNKKLSMLILSIIYKNILLKKINEHKYLLYFNIYNIFICTNSNLIGFLLNYFVSPYIFLKISGRGYKIRRRMKYLNLLFNKSHPNLIFIKRYIIRIKKKKKKKKFLFFFSSIAAKYLTNKLCLVKPLSIYTKKGLFLSSFLRIKKKGKIYS